jgi:hypothetical protein
VCVGEGPGGLVTHSLPMVMLLNALGSSLLLSRRKVTALRAAPTPMHAPMAGPQARPLICTRACVHACSEKA